MSNPVKSPAKDRFTELSVADTRLIVYGSICFNGPKVIGPNIKSTSPDSR
jgi:hypothetical protein